MAELYKNGMGMFTKKQRRIFAAVILIVILCISVTAFALTRNGNKIADEEIQEYLSELSYQTSYKVGQRIDTNFNTLISLDENLKVVSDDEREMLIENALNRSAFEEIGYIDDQGIFKVDNEGLINVSDTNILKELKQGNNAVSERLIELDDGQKGVIYAVAHKNDKHIALAGWIPTDTMELLLNTDTLEGNGFSHIVSMDGDYILKSQNKNAVLNQGDNFFEMLEKKGNVENKKDVTMMKNKMLNGESGKIEYDVEGDEKRSLTYVPLKKANWYLLSIVPSDAYVYDIHQFTSYSILAIAAISVILFSALTIAILLISYRKNKVISNIAYVDPVTNGFTKARFDQELKLKLRNFTPFTYIMIDVRKFKLINDLKGSKGGDEVLKHVYQCIQNNLDEDEFVSRIHADNFELVFNTIDHETIVQRLSDISESINKFNDKRKTPYYLPIDCGIYIVDKADQDMIIIRDRANAARKNNKENSQTHLCSCVYYNDLERLQMVQEKEIDNAMENALENEEFIVYFQPKVNIQTNKVAGAEALIRWNNPSMGFLSPDKFIPYFEKTGFIVKLDRFVFESVCRQIRTWIDQGIEPVPISVNLSRRDLYEKDYLEHYKEIQEKYQVPSHLLEIEFTETLFFEDLELLKESIQQVHDAGYLCSIDDFGSGYSSLALLKEISVDILKLDKTFFDSEANTRGDKVIEHVIALAKDLKMQTIAEGIETVIQVERLKNVKCDMIQGYVYYKPMTIEDFNKIVDQGYEIIHV